jgi:hypothetical protein
MGFYSRLIFPVLCDWMMNDPKIAGLRQAFLTEVGRKMLQIGIGDGLNLEYYPKCVRGITAADPGQGMIRLARPAALSSCSGRLQTCMNAPACW